MRYVFKTFRYYLTFSNMNRIEYRLYIQIALIRIVLLIDSNRFDIIQHNIRHIIRLNRQKRSNTIKNIDFLFKKSILAYNSIYYEYYSKKIDFKLKVYLFQIIFEID